MVIGARSEDVATAASASSPSRGEAKKCVSWGPVKTHRVYVSETSSDKDDRVSSTIHRHTQREMKATVERGITFYLFFANGSGPLVRQATHALFGFFAIRAAMELFVTLCQQNMFKSVLQSHVREWPKLGK